MTDSSFWDPITLIGIVILATHLALALGYALRSRRERAEEAARLRGDALPDVTAARDGPATPPAAVNLARTSSPEI